MDLARAVDTIEYKIATESDSFKAGRTIKLSVTTAWPLIAAIADILQRKYPGISLQYDYQANDLIQLIIMKK